jgi:hypothetical protein
MAFLNERVLYRTKCKNCHGFMISRHHPDSKIVDWCLKCHISDSWDGRDYGQDYDFSKNFFLQFKELKKVVPHRSLDRNERNGPECEYSNYCFTSSNIYLSYCVHKSEQLKYCKNTYLNTKNCLDSLRVKKSERCYEIVQASENFDSAFLVESDQCISSSFLFDCVNCINCCMSSNLRNKSNVFRNQQLAKGEYEKAVAELKLDTYSGQVKAKKEFIELAKNSIHRYASVINSLNCTGDFIANAKNCIQCFGIDGAENMKNVFFGMNKNSSDSQDLIMTGSGSESYESSNAGRGINKISFTISCGSGSRNLFYCEDCRACVDCFGCLGLKNQQYCILNKQYNKEEYFEIIEKIKKQMDEISYIDKLGRKYTFGEFFPPELSPFAYNESLAFEEEPLPKEEILAHGYKWQEPELKDYVPTVTAEELPESIKDTGDSICNEIIRCPNNGKVESQCSLAFRILPDEFAFYRQMKLPIPRYCPNCRYNDRLQWINKFKFFKRNCMCEFENHGHLGKCSKQLETMYPPERPEKIYCEECYKKEIY